MATASISEVKEILITSSAIEDVVNEIGLKPVNISDLKIKQSK